MKARLLAKWTPLVVAICLLALAVGVDTGRASACTPPPPTPWFGSKLELLSTNLPDSITINPTSVHGLKFVNSNPSSVWIKADFVYPENPRGLEIAPGETAAVTENFGGPEGNANESLFWSMSDESFGYGAQSLETRNKYGDNRPTDYKIPEPQAIAVSAELDQQLYEIKVRVSYYPNPYYRSDSLFVERNACSGWLERQPFQGAPPQGCLCISIALIGFAVAGYRSFGKKSPETMQSQ